MDSKVALMILLISLTFGAMALYDKRVEADYFSVCDIDRLAECRPQREFTMLMENSTDRPRVQNATARPQFDVNFVVVQRSADGVVYRVPHLIRSSLLKDGRCAYRGVVRPYLTCNGTHGLFDGFYLESKVSVRDPAEEAAALRAAIDAETDPVLLARYTFYLAYALERSGEDLRGGQEAVGLPAKTADQIAPIGAEGAGERLHASRASAQDRPIGERARS